MAIESRTRSRSENYSLFLAIGLGWGIAIAFFFAFKGVGSFSDEGSFCAIAQGILDGRLPYKDYFNEKVPLQYFWTAFVMRFTTDGIQGARIASTITLGSALSLSLSRLSKWPASLGLTLLWAVIVALIGLVMRVYNNSAESTAAFLSVACALMIFDRRGLRSGRQALGVGLLQGLACGFHQTMVASACVVLISPWLRAWRRLFLAGFLLGLALWSGMLWYLGILQQTLEATVLFHLNNPSMTSYFRLILENDYPALVIWLLSLGALLIVALQERETLWVLGWVMAVALPFFGRMDGFRLWPSTLLILTYLFSRRSGSVKLIGIAPFLVAAVAGAATMDRPENFEWIERINQRIKKYAGQTGTIWVGPYEPDVYCVSKRAPAAKYYFILPWILKPGVPQELVKEISDHKPQLIVDVSNSTYSIKKLVPDLDRLIQEKYGLAERDGDVRYFVLRDAPRPTSASNPHNP